DQASVVGHDNTLEPPLSRPPLTTIDPDKPTLAATVLGLLTVLLGCYDGSPRMVDTPPPRHAFEHRGAGLSDPTPRSTKRRSSEGILLRLRRGPCPDLPERVY